MFYYLIQGVEDTVGETSIYKIRGNVGYTATNIFFRKLGDETRVLQVTEYR